MMEQLFDSGHAADIVLLALLIEALWLRRKGWLWRDLAPMLLPAALIVVGLRAALTGAPWPLVSLPLALSFPVHLLDLVRRGKALGRSSS
ncbi:MAG: hypothetical protein ACK4G2_12800 [Novosphingobium sp.]